MRWSLPLVVGFVAACGADVAPRPPDAERGFLKLWVTRVIHTDDEPPTETVEFALSSFCSDIAAYPPSVSVGRRGVIHRVPTPDWAMCVYIEREPDQLPIGPNVIVHWGGGNSALDTGLAFDPRDLVTEYR